MAATFNDESVSDQGGVLTADLASWLHHYPLYKPALSKVYLHTPRGALPVTRVELDERGDILITSEDV